MLSTKRNPTKKPAPICSKEPTLNDNEPIVLSLITPIFGGGVDPRGAADEKYPIRPSAIKGQLRFWWRAARGGDYSNLIDLNSAEERLWGGLSSPGIVRLSVDQSNIGDHTKCWIFRDDDSPCDNDLAYIGFPLRSEKGKGVERKDARPAMGYKKSFRLFFTLNDSNDQFRHDVDAAIWAWKRFGGIGGRTRRGFGSLDICDEKLDDIDNWLLSEHIVKKAPPYPIPSLAPESGARICRITRRTDPQKAWKKCAMKYKDFRKTLSKNNRAYRAYFGLPIASQSCEIERYASPLIIKAVGTKNHAVGIGLVLGNRYSQDQNILDHMLSLTKNNDNDKTKNIRLHTGRMKIENDHLYRFLNENQEKQLK